MNNINQIKLNNSVERTCQKEDRNLLGMSHGMQDNLSDGTYKI